MEMLMDYHLLFIVIAIMLLILTIFFIFLENTKHSTIAAMLLAGVNYLLCLIVSFGFFSIGLLGADPMGIVSATAYHEMYALYGFFFLLHFLNIILIFYCYYLWAKDIWNVEPKKKIYEI